MGACAPGDEESGGAPAPARQGNLAPPAQQALHGELLPLFDRIHAGEDQVVQGELRFLLERAEEPGGPQAYQVEFLLGYSYHRQKLYERARQHFEAATERQPDYHTPYHFLGFARLALGDLEGAGEAFRQHQQLSPGEGDDAFGLALCALDQGLLDEAQAHLEQALAEHQAAADRGRDRRRELAKVLARMGDVAGQRGDTAGARERYERAVMLWPGQDEIWHKLERVLRRQGEDGLAEIAAQRAAAWRERERGSG